MIHSNGWHQYNIWEHSATVRDLYGRRCRLEAEEMTCHQQAVTLLKPYVSPGDTLLDVGCGSGYFFHSLRKGTVPVEYWGIDATAVLIDIGQQHLPTFGLPAHQLQPMRIEDLGGKADHVVCINVLSNLDNYHRPLERLLNTAQKTVILRESLAPVGDYAYVRDRFLDDGVDLKVHVNTYPVQEVCDFIRSYGFQVESIPDQRTGDVPEMVIGYPHHWRFLVAVRQQEAGN
jgi:SAM-dependent methyltransferase